ncbi:MAG: hypothetical protein Q8L84_10025 [Hyphomonas sp.]|nr:hypothetical protein [Hyphomonas sp.]
MSAPIVVSLRARLDAIRAKLVFGEAAVAAGLKGSSRSGWECPNCRTEGSVRERSDRQGGRCSMHDCRKGYDLAGLVMSARGLSALQAATFLERVIEEKQAAGNPKAPGLFAGLSGGEG